MFRIVYKYIKKIVGRKENEVKNSSYKEISYSTLLTLKESRQYVIVDIRTKHEYDKGHLTGAISFPEYNLINNFNRLPKDKKYIFVCQNGKNSRYVAKALAGYGYITMNLSDGLSAIKK